MNEALPCNYRFLAQYNRWINQRLYGACSTLCDEERKRDRGAFFGSLHRTLNHLVLTDQMWMQRFMRCGLEHGVTLAGLEAAGLELPAGSQLDTVLLTQAGVDVGVTDLIALAGVDFAT